MKKVWILSVAALLAATGYEAAQAAEDALTLPEASVSALKKARAGDAAPKIQKTAAFDFEFRFGDHRGGRGDWRGGPGRGRNDRWRGPGRGPGRDRGYGRYRQEIVCNATDKGWEEHWGGHRSRGYDLPRLERGACGECLRKHGTCNFRCVTEEVRCSARFVPERSNGGFESEVWGDSRPRRWDAEDSALDRCWRRNRGRAGRCEPTGRCSDVGRHMSGGRCRK
jgi:hypothetical protein